MDFSIELIECTQCMVVNLSQRGEEREMIEIEMEINSNIKRLIEKLPMSLMT